MNDTSTNVEEKIEEQDWYIWLKSNRPRTAEEIKEFEEMFPNAKGEVIFMLKARLFGWLGL